MKIVSAAVVAAFAVLCAVPAHAQSTSPIPNPFKDYAIKIGVYVPIDSGTRRGTDDYYYSVGVTYDIFKPKIPVVGALLPKFAVETFGDVITAGTEGTFVNVGVGVRVAFGAASPFYIGAGIGGSYLSTNFYNGNGGRNRESDFKAIGKATLGFSLPVGFFVEGEYTQLGKVRGVDLNGGNARVGFRF